MSGAGDEGPGGAAGAGAPECAAGPAEGRAPSRGVYGIFVWHGFFLSLTKATLDRNTIFPALVGTLVASKTVFGVLHAIMLGVPVLVVGPAGAP